MTVSHSEAERQNNAKLRELGYITGPTGESFSEFVSMKVISAKRTHQYGTPYGANSLAMVCAQYKDLLRNVCVRVDALHAAELDALTEILDCNKQEFVLELLIAGIEQTKSALKSAGLERAFDEAVDNKLNDLGFSVEPANEEGFWGTNYKGKPIINNKAEHHEKMAGAISRTIAETLPDGDT